ncbi:MAG: sulfotransferase [Solirubrobacterales bacterium]
MLPTFVIIGSAKSGTTALHSYLSAHPEIHMSAVKETHYFADPSGYFPFGRIGDRTEYEAQFETNLAIRGETSPSYSLYPLQRDVPKRLRAAIPGAKIIYLVRDPLARMEALYRQRAAWQRLGSFEETIGDVEDPLNEYACGSRYMRQLDQYLEHFRREQIMVVDQDELRHGRRATLAAVFAFLDADPSFWSDDYLVDQNISAAKRHLPQRYRQIARSPIARSMVGLLPTSARARVTATGRRIVSRPIPAPELRPQAEARWREFFAAEIEALREFSELRFDSWSF